MKRFFCRLSLLFPVFVCILPLCSQPAGAPDLYGDIDPTAYLTGQFAFDHHPAFATAASYGIPDRGRGVYLRREALEAIQKMYAQIQKDLPGVPFWVQSGTRNFASQKSIWESKWNGNVAVGGIRLNTVKDPVERARRILTYTSMPGTSRHHWGTDFDINSLTVDFYRSGEGKKLYQWMLAHAPKYGFCLVYTEGRKEGYEFEPWHWSFKPLSAPLIKEWERLHEEKKIKGADLKFAGAPSAFSLAQEYVGSINAECR